MNSATCKQGRTFSEFLARALARQDSACTGTVRFGQDTSGRKFDLLQQDSGANETFWNMVVTATAALQMQTRLIAEEAGSKTTLVHFPDITVRLAHAC